MELIMKKLSMLQRKCEAVSQITFDEDMNVQDDSKEGNYSDRGHSDF